VAGAPPLTPVDGVPSSAVTGVGLGLRLPFLRPLLETRPASVRWLEVHPENYMRRGGAYAAALEQCRGVWPVVTHGLTMGFGKLEPVPHEDLAALGRFLERVQTPWHSDHLCVSSVGGAELHELLPIPFDRATVHAVARRVREMCDAIERPVAVENVSAYARVGGAPTDEAAFLLDVLDAADAGLLLDVNNVYVNACNFGFDPWRFVDALPAERIWQIHVAGHDVRTDGLRLDTHAAPVAAPVLGLLGHVLRRTGPRPVLLERDGRFPPFAELVAELDAVDTVYRAATGGAAAQPAVLGHHERGSRETAAPAAPATPAPERRAAGGRRDEAHPRRARRGAALTAVGEQAAGAREEAVLRTCFAAEPSADDVVASGLPEDRLRLYRRMVRGNFRAMAEAGLPRTRAAVSAGAWHAAITNWLAACPPRSRFVRDVVGEFAAHAGPRWAAATGIAGWVPDLLRFEAICWEVAHAEAPDPRPTPGPFVFETPAVLAPTLRVARFGYPVHRKGPEQAGGFLPEPTVIAVYRRGPDGPGGAAWHVVEALEAGLLRAWSTRGPSAPSARDAAEAVRRALGQPLGPRFVVELSRVVQRLLERGVLLGSVPG